MPGVRAVMREDAWYYQKRGIMNVLGVESPQYLNIYLRNIIRYGNFV